MKMPVLCFLAITSFLAPTVHAQAPVVANPNHEAMLASPDARLAKNKRLVYDFWREVVEAGNVPAADKYIGEEYIQHNPNLPSGRAAFASWVAKNIKQQALKPRVRSPLVSIIAEGDLVVVSLVAETTDPKNPSSKTTTTWFDMFRIANGKIVEHWDAAPKLP